MKSRQKPPRPQPRAPRRPSPMKAPTAKATPPNGTATTFFALPKRRSEPVEPNNPTPEPIHVRAVPTPSSGPPKTASKPAEIQGRSPFQVAQPLPPPPAQRARSWRVYGIVLSLFALCFMGMLTAVGTIVLGTELAAAQTEHTPAHHAAAPTPTNVDDLVDTGRPQPPPPPPPVRVPRQPVHTPSKNNPITAPTVTRPSAAPGTIGITVSGATFLQVEAKCPGVRKRGAFVNGKATIQGIPANVKCDLHFKGGMPAKYIGVQAGNSYQCVFVQGTAVCKA